jgi:hypothetical protein
MVAGRRAAQIAFQFDVYRLKPSANQFPKLMGFCGCKFPGPKWLTKLTPHWSMSYYCFVLAKIDSCPCSRLHPHTIMLQPAAKWSDHLRSTAEIASSVQYNAICPLHLPEILHCVAEDAFWADLQHPNSMTTHRLPDSDGITSTTLTSLPQCCEWDQSL